MTSNLDDLFNQIIHSERHAQQKKKYLNDLKCRIQLAFERKKELQKQHTELKQELISKINVLSKEEVNLSCLEKREKILEDKKSELENEKKSLQHHLKNLEKEKEKLMEMFCTDAGAFIQDFGLQSNSHISRADQKKESINQLKEMEGQLVIEKEATMKRTENLSKLQTELKQKQDILESLQSSVLGLEKDLQNAKCENEVLENKKKAVNEVPQTNPEFLKLNKELDALNSECLEQKCLLLHEDLQHLQQILWQKQVCERKKHTNQSSQPAQLRRLDEESCKSTNKITLSNFNSHSSSDHQNMKEDE